jgi:hypothetical protein
MEAALSECFQGKAHVRGEEDLSTMTVTEHELLVLVDPLDGTGPAREIADGYSSVALCYIKRPGPGFELLGAAVCSSGIVVTWTAAPIVQRGLADQPADSDSVLVDIFPGKEDTLAIVAAKHADRVRNAELLTGLEGGTVYNTGGTPRTWALLGLDLGAMVAVKSQAPWDAAYLLPVIDTGGVVITKNGAVDRSTVISWFEDFQLDPDGAKTIPPHVVASSQTAAERAARFLGD